MHLHVRPKERYVLFPVTCLKFLGSVGRQTLFFYKNLFVWKKYENPYKQTKNRLLISQKPLKSLSRPQNIRVGRVS